MVCGSASRYYTDYTTLAHMLGVGMPQFHLRDYISRTDIVDGIDQCNATVSLKEFFDMVYEEPKKMLLYGDACRASTDPIAKASYFFDLIQISYADTDPIYTIENYPNFFRVVPSENALSLARIPFIRHHNWTRVGTIYQNLPRYSLPHSKLLTDLERYKIVIKQSVSLPGSVDGLQDRDLGDELRKLKEKDVRIILGNFDEEWALLLFCEAYREKMTGRKYQWLLTGVSEDKLWQHYKTKGSSCTEQELLIAMDGYIITDIAHVSRSQHPTVSGLMAHEFSNEYVRRARDMNISIAENKFYGYVYDGIWAIALALNRVDHKLKYYSHLSQSGKATLNPEIEGLTSLLDFDYHKPIWAKLIRNALNKTRFEGVTGTVTFMKNERPGLIQFSQFQAFRDMNEVIIGSYDALNNDLNLKVGYPIFWRGHSPPVDYTIEKVTPFRINRTLFVIISILALFGIVLAFIFLFINIKYRNQRYIKMSSPYLNNLIIIGCILTYTSVIILGLDSGLTSESNFPFICNARAWVLMAGFTLAFGSMFSKTFRVHSIFTNIKLHKKVIKDYKLFMVVLILLTFDFCILIVWQYFDPFYRQTNNGTSIQDSDNEDIIIVPEMEFCQSKRMTVFLSIIYVYKGLLMAFGCFLAWETRHVSIPALNDSKYIGLSVYNVVIMCVIGASLSFVLRDQQDASFVIISIFIIFCSTTTLCLVFVPKLIELKQNPRASDHRVRATLKTFKKSYRDEALGVTAGCRDIHGNLIGRGYGVDLNEKIKILVNDNLKQRVLLKEKTYELEALTYKYRKVQNMIQSGQYLMAFNTTAAPSCPTPLGGSSPIPSNLIQKVGSMHAKNRPVIHDKVSFSSPIKNDQNLNVIGQKLDLTKSSLMSSTTQITTTNTTSSTNNNTDMTDYSCSKFTEINTTTSTTTCSSSLDGQNKRAIVTMNGNKMNGMKISPSDNNLAISKSTPLSSKINNDNHKNIENILLRSNSGRLPQDPNDEYLDSSIAPDDKKINSDNFDLFAIFSYMSNNGNLDRNKRPSKNEMATTNFSRWSEGPFCTLMVRHNDNRVRPTLGNQPGLKAPGRAVLKNQAGMLQSHTNNKQQQKEGEKLIQALHEEVHASCPDIRATKTSSNLSRLSSKTPKKRFLAQQVKSPPRSRLPRTMSMIEYLGLLEFDSIVRRHDRLISRQLNLNNRSICCCESAVCCQMAQGDSDTRLASKTGRVFSEFPQQQSERNLAFCSSDPLNSLCDLQTSSHPSCSICCSLGGSTYASQWDMMADETTSSATSSTSHSSRSISMSGTTSSSSANVDRSSHQQYLSGTQSSSSDHSGSTMDNQTYDNNIKTLCQHHHQTPIHDYSHSFQQTHPGKLRSCDAHLEASSKSFEGSNKDNQQATDRSTLDFHRTSEPLCCPPTVRDDEDHPKTSILGCNPASSKTMATTKSPSSSDEEDEITQKNLEIKCDILESL